jgi:hypothetical protein
MDELPYGANRSRVRIARSTGSTLYERALVDGNDTERRASRAHACTVSVTSRDHEQHLNFCSRSTVFDSSAVTATKLSTEYAEGFDSRVSTSRVSSDSEVVCIKSPI